MHLNTNILHTHEILKSALTGTCVFSLELKVSYFNMIQQDCPLKYDPYVTTGEKFLFIIMQWPHLFLTLVESVKEVIAMNDGVRDAVTEASS